MKEEVAGEYTRFSFSQDFSSKTAREKIFSDNRVSIDCTDARAE